MRFHVVGHEGERMYGKVIFDLGLEICTDYWDMDMVGDVTLIKHHMSRWD